MGQEALQVLLLEVNQQRTVEKSHRRGVQRTWSEDWATSRTTS